MRSLVIAQTLPVDMPDHRGTLRAACPIMAGLVVAGRKSAAVRLRAGQCIVPVGRIAAPVDDFALLRQRGLLSEIVVPVELVDILGDDRPFAVPPRPAPNPIAPIDRGLAIGHLRAEIGAPGVPARSNRLRAPNGDLRAVPPAGCHDGQRPV